jgi:hypothetical protein
VAYASLSELGKKISLCQVRNNRNVFLKTSICGGRAQLLRIPAMANSCNEYRQADVNGDCLHLGMVARFFVSQYTKTWKIYQITSKYTKVPQNMPNGSKIDQMAMKYTSIFHCQTLQNLPKLGFFGLKIYHLAILRLGTAKVKTKNT